MKRLEAFERWMARELARSTDAKLDRRRRIRIEREVEPTRELAPAQRLAIYADSIRARLIDVLEQDFPATRRALGPQRFARIAREYVERHPPRHFSLNQLGAKLPSFLRRSARTVPRRAFVADLAELERAVQEVFDAPREAPLAREELLAISAESWPTLQLVPIHALRIVRSRFAVDAYLQSVLDGRRVPRIIRRTSSTLVWRRELAVQRRELDPREAELLDRILRGTPLGVALSGCRTAPAEIVTWFRTWAADALFGGLRAHRRRTRRPVGAKRSSRKLRAARKVNDGPVEAD